MRPRCLKCGESHRTSDCPIREKIANLVCINCNKTEHMANWSQWEEFPKRKPKKGETGLGLNPREGIDVCKCIVPLRHGDTLNRRRAASPLVRLEEGEESCQVIYSQFGLPIHQNDHQARRRFVEWAQNVIAVVPDFHKRILFKDEAHFWLNGYINKQNCRIWSEANPQVYIETPLHPEKLTVWCALWAGGIIGPYFFKNDEGHNATVNGDQYRAMITNFFIPELNSHDVQELWFQQDGATCHTARATIDLLKGTFGGLQDLVI
ncbi:uncharacterized protein TNCV_792291 [Trichonephila clavipes]|nr:uncharacterized protein TNCV_792291 [Trichonephila clavipes]